MNFYGVQYSADLVTDDVVRWAGSEDVLPEFCDENGLVFDDSVMKTSLVVDFGLICGSASGRAFVNITYMIGAVF